MQFSGKHFIYDGINSRRYGLKFLHIDTEPFKKVSGTPTYQKNFYKSTKSNSITGMEWDDSPINTEVELISEKPISKKELRAIEKWLFNRSQYCKLYIDKREDEDIEVINGVEKQCYVECVFYDAKVIEYIGGIYGFSATMELSCSYAIQDSITKEIKSNSNNSYTESKINVDTDDNDYVYPIITIECKNINEIEVINESDNNRAVKLSDYERKVFSNFQDVKNSILNGTPTYIFRDVYQDHGVKKLYFSPFSDILSSVYKKGQNLSEKKLKIEWSKLSSDSFLVQTVIHTSKGYSINFGDNYDPDTFYFDTVFSIYSPESQKILEESYTEEPTYIELPDVGEIDNIYYRLITGDGGQEQFFYVNSTDTVVTFYKTTVEANELCKNSYIGEEIIYWYDDENSKVPVTLSSRMYWYNELMFISSNKLANKTIFMNCQTGSVINSENENCYDCILDQKFLRLFNGENKLKIKGEVNIIIQYQQKRFIR